MNKEYIAHVRKNKDGSWAEPHILSEHLRDTAARAEMSSAKFNSGEWGRFAGLAHDTGKGRVKWQNYLKLASGYDEEAHLEGKNAKIPHAIHGAVLAEKMYGKWIGRILAYCIAGHHAGLPDWSSSEGAGRSSLQYQITQFKDMEEIDRNIEDQIYSLKPLLPPWEFDRGLDMSLWIRLLFSSLVDADFLDTEAYMDKGKAESRIGYMTMLQLLDRFNVFAAKMDQDAEDTKVNQIRREIRSKCCQMAHEDQSIFYLSVPTGGGKTLSSLAFALEHAVKHHLERIIYVIPYTSIIEQNADVFRSVLGQEQVVEHHSSLDDSDSDPRSRLAAENWDAPVIVTTSVQFFESLFAAKPSRCRKLHNIARSIVILDEAQLVPVNYLAPILETMQLLTDHYQVTFVISTATQPAFSQQTIGDKTFPGLKNVKEIMGSSSEVNALYESLNRCQMVLPADLSVRSSWEEVAGELKQYDQVLCIVSDRKSCRELHSLMPDGTYHLSALMCGQHRSEIINEIKQKLKNNQPVRVISTQLVEAGVDFDFPVVYRALAGLDSIAQAAGRCNREGKLADGQVVVFIPPRAAPIGILRKAADTASNIILTNSDPLNHDVFKEYFAELYWKANSLDEKDIVALLSREIQDCSIYFRTAAERFHIIDDSQQKSILIRYGEGDKIINQLKSFGPDRWLLRRLQRYTVNVYKDQFYQLLEAGLLEEVYPNIYAITSSNQYSRDIGLVVDTNFDPEFFII